MSKATTVICSLLTIAISLAISTTVRAQGNGRAPIGTGGRNTIQGQIYLPSGRRAGGQIHVKLKALGEGEISILAASDGTFFFPTLSPGNYTVTVDAGNDYDIATENVFFDTEHTGVSVAGQRYTVVVHLKPSRNAQQSTSTVVVDSTLAAIPDGPRKLYETSLSLAQAGDSRKAIDNLKTAITQYPNFSQALNELGVQYLKVGQADKAVEPLAAAVKISPDGFRPNLNLGIAYLETKQFNAAESQLQTAVKLNDTSATAHMYLGIAYISEKKLDEAQTELETATTSNAVEVAKAHYYLGGIYWGNHDYDRAATALETYLKLVPKAPEAAKVRDTIKELRSKK